MSKGSSLEINRIIIKHEKDYIINLLSGLLQCKICSNILTDPYDCLCCNQTFCFSCICNYVSKNKKCPYGLYLTREEDDEFNLLSKLKPTSLNIINIINTITVTCINARNGCFEELTLRELPEHEKNCAFQGNNNNIVNHSSQNTTGNLLENTKTLSRCNSNCKSGDMKKIPLMSFNKADTGLDPFEEGTSTYNNGNVNDKLDKIFDSLQYLQMCINKNTPKDKDFGTETPKFNLSYTTNKQPESSSNYNSNFIFHELKENIGNMAFTTNTYHNNYISSEGEKILSEFENIHERLDLFQSHLDNRFFQNEISVRKMIEEHISSLSEKNTGNASLLQMPSSTSNANANSIQINNTKNTIFPSTLLLKESEASPASINFSDKQLYKPKSVESLNNKTNSAEGTSKKVSHYIPQNIPLSPSSPSNFILANRKSPLPSKFLTKTGDAIQDKFTERIDKLEQNIITNILESSENMKKYLNDSCVEEIKRTNFEVMMDSSNLFVQKIDEVLEKLK